MRWKTCILVALTSLSWGCTGHIQKNLDHISIRPNLKDPRLQEILQEIDAGNFHNASNLLNATLQDYPRNPALHLVNGILYEHLGNSDPDKAELASVAYQNAFTQDPTNWYALYLMGRHHLKRRAYKKAQDYYAQALLLKPNNMQVLHEFSTASYYAQDLGAARVAIEKVLKALKKDPNVNRSATLIFAATGDFKKAKQTFKIFTSQCRNHQEIRFIIARLRDWKRFHKKNQILLQQKQQAPQVKPIEIKHNLSTHQKDMVIFDCYFLRVSEEGGSQKGQNILDLLTVNLLTAPQNEISIKDSGGLVATIFQNGISWESLKYNLNIANAKSARVQVVGRPTLTAYLKKGANFQSGRELVAGITGGSSAGIITKTSIGSHLTITPNEIEGDRVKFNISLQASILDELDKSKAITEQILIINNTKISTDLEVRFDETAMLGGLYQRTDSDSKAGVPILQSLPLIQYFFSKENRTVEKKSILFLVTPRRAQDFQKQASDQLRHNPRSHAVKELLDDERNLFSSPYNTTEIISYLAPVYRELRYGDLNPNRQRDLGASFKEEISYALKFLHF